MDDRIGGMKETIITVAIQAELRVGQIAAKDSNPGLEKLIKALEAHVQLESLPEADFGLMRVSGAHQDVEGGAMLVEEIGGDVSADVSG